MRLRMRCALFFVLLMSAVPALAHIDIVPRPQHLTAGRGVFTLTHRVSIEAPDNARSQWIAHFLSDKIRQRTAVAVDVVTKTAPDQIRLRLDPSLHGEGAYRLDVSEHGVSIAAADNRGLFWGVQTLRQLLPQHLEPAPSVACVHIRDAPHFPWRGVMLDVSRHVYPVAYIKKQIALMSYYKFNVFHWHLTDDEGWRIQIRRYPKLTGIGAWRTGADGRRYGGFYTRRQIRAVVAYARQRNVRVVPEIEMPGHTSAAIAAYPALSCHGRAVKVPAAWGGFRNVDCVGKDSTFTFLDNVLDEVVQLFPSPYIHIGSDEVPPGAWSDCTACQRLVRAHGLKGQAGLHGYFVNRIARFLARRGRTVIGWDEVLKSPHLEADAVIEVWHAPDVGKAFARGHRVILSAPFYLDRATDDRTLQDLYRDNPFTKPLYRQHPSLILGGEAALWSERATPLNADARLYPRLLAVAEHVWNPDAAPDWTDFLRRVVAQQAWLTAQGVAYGSINRTLVGYRVTRNNTYQRWRIRAARGFDAMRLHYTLDGRQPTAHSPSFEDVLDLYRPATVTVAPFIGDVPYEAAQRFHLLRHLALGDPVSFVKPPQAPYAGSPARLTNGILAHPLGSAHFRDGSWDGWRGTDMDASVDLRKPTAVHSIRLRFLDEPGNWVLLPRTVTFKVSMDGTRWKTLRTVVWHPDPRGTGTFVRTAVYRSRAPVTARYVRVVATGYGQPMSGLNTWILTDQIIVR